MPETRDEDAGDDSGLQSNSGAQDDPSIPDDAEVLRSFYPGFVSAVEGGPLKPSRQAFQEITDEVTGVRAMSVYRADVLDGLGIDHLSIIDQHPHHLIVALQAGFVRELGLGIVPAIEEGEVGQAHCHVMGKLTRGRQSRLTDAVVLGKGRWVKGPAV